MRVCNRLGKREDIRIVWVSELDELVLNPSRCKSVTYAFALFVFFVSGRRVHRMQLVKSRRFGFSRALSPSKHFFRWWASYASHAALQVKASGGFTCVACSSSSKDVSGFDMRLRRLNLFSSVGVVCVACGL